MGRKPGRLRGQGGLALVELVVVAAVLAVAAVLVIEGTWAYAQQTNVRNSAELGAELAASNFGTPAQIGEQVCNNLDLAQTPSRVTLTPSSGDGSAGDLAEITVERGHRTITGLLNRVFLRGGLHAGVEFRIERPETGTVQWWNDGRPSTYTCSV